MRGMQYAIRDNDTGLYVQWDEAVVLFDTEEEVRQMMKDFPFFFIGKDNIEFEYAIHFPDKSVNYKDIKETNAYKESMSNE